VLTQGADDERVEFGDDDAREARVLEELAGAGAVAAAEDGSARRGVARAARWARLSWIMNSSASAAMASPSRR
jgi:hypothetical protein